MTRDEIDAKRREYSNAACEVWLHTPPHEIYEFGHSEKFRQRAERMAAERYPYPRTLRVKMDKFGTMWRWNPEQGRLEYRSDYDEERWLAADFWEELRADLKAHPYVEGD